jgi:hypothetical protein
MNAMTAPEPAEAFGRFVNQEQALLALLRARLPSDQTMLADMREAVAQADKSG